MIVPLFLIIFILLLINENKKQIKHILTCFRQNEKKEFTFVMRYTFSE